ncbi:MAG: ABC transporter permease [Chloroflexota bacterium]|nr:ABC transporter permease [Chloroflexota bacterium]
MSRYIISRILWLGPVMLGVSLLVFSIVKLMPGDVARALVGTNGTAEDVAAMRQTLGLDRPVYVQYMRFLDRLVHLDLGNSAVTRRPVTTEIASRIPATAELAGAALLIALVLGMVTGIVSATMQYSVWDNLATLVSLVGVSMPTFWLGLMLMLLFSVRLGWLPSTGSGSVAQLILPALTLGSASTAIIARQTRSSLLDVLRQDYVRTAHAKGIASPLVLLRHALPNALIPTVTAIGLQVGYLLGGSVLTETVFARPGLGRLLVDAIQSRDLAIVQGTIMLLSAVFVIVNLAVDLIYVRLDPRIRYD